MSDDLVNTVLGDVGSEEELSQDQLEELTNSSGSNKSQQEEEALYPLLGCVALINDESIKQFVRAVLLEAPAVFWVQPANTAEAQSPPDETLEGGLVLRVERMTRASLYIANAQDFGLHEQDLLLAAALIHTVTRYVPTEVSVQQDPMYPYTIDMFVHNTRYEYAREYEAYMSGENDDPDIVHRSSPVDIEDDDLATILRLVRCHRGSMSPIPETIPVTTLEWALHTAYYVTCNLHHIIDGDNIQKGRWMNH